VEAERDRPAAGTSHASAGRCDNDPPSHVLSCAAPRLPSSTLRFRLGVERWIADQQGAVAIVVGLASIGLLGVGAVVVDVGMLYAEKAELQNGADAAALAVAEGCAADACGDIWAVAQSLAEANASDGAAQVDDVDVVSQRVVVTVSSATAAGGSAVRHRLAPLLGFDETTVTATAAADWGGPIGGTAVVPLAISWCAFEAHTGGGVPSSDIEQTITYLADGGAGCHGPSGQVIPGGFGWLETDDDECGATSSSLDAQTPGKPGVSTPGTCAPIDFERIREDVVLLPIFEDAGGTGSSGWFKIHGYAAFRVTGYRFACPSGYRWNDGNSPCGSNTERFIRGYFTQFVTLDDAFQFGGPDLGARVVALTR